MTSQSDGVAYSSSRDEVLDAWSAYRRHVEETRTLRTEMTERYGRRLMLSRHGFGHGTRAVGFEQLDGDVDGQVLGDNGELRVPKKGPPYSTVVPNTRRKVGQELQAELSTLGEKGPELPGMPGFVLAGMRCLAPALLEHDGTVWARWSDEITDHADTGGGLDLGVWRQRPLSEYFAVVEARA